ncbi:LOW QUALITY PROTEIN: uncharacterized protein LOC127788456 [Diospyros lotus]|uniref:LOW QUALITY PROTEIN: uncharacterized protein LOC127788456 n=1 Tax=Diospyros lotus TaxID=55363 RepID=UPI002256F5F6|nr:LOW QUALITY PROTEIN: uncharacterized protein LOC127788456 [Diospyros lotus]
MEGAIEVDLDAKIAEIASRARGKRTGKVGAKNKGGKRRKEEQTAVLDRKSAPADNGPPEISISMFDCSVENHFRAIERICKVSGEAECDGLEKSEVERLSTSITFLREWWQFNYQPRAVQFACQNESSPQGKDVISGITLPPFSAATVPRKDEEKNLMSMESRKDFVMYVGGPVWALDWCPRVHQRSGHHVKCEFIAVAAHPAEFSYHKIGAPLIGRGLVQVWCILTTGMKEDEVPQVSKKPKQSPSVTRTKVRSPQSKRQRWRPRKNPINESGDNLNGNDQYLQPHAHLFPENLSNFLPKLKSPPSKKQRGRPRKKAENESLDNLNGNDHHQALAVRPPENSCNLLPLDIVSTNVHKDHAENDSGSKRKDSCQGLSAGNSLLASSSVRSLEDNGRTRESTHEHDLPSLTMKVKSPQSKRQRGRPRKNPINESGDNLNGNDQYLQPHAHLFPESLSNFLPKLKSPPSKKQRGRSRKKAENESLDNLNGNDHHLQALAVQPPENSYNLLPLDIVSTDVHKDHAENDSGSKRRIPAKEFQRIIHCWHLSVRSLEDNARTRESMHEHDLPSLTMKVKSPQSKRQRGRPRKNPINESGDNLNGNDQYLQPHAHLFPENLSSFLPKLKSPPSKKQRGRPRKKAENESLDNLNGNDHHLQALAVQPPENSYNLLPLDIVSTDVHKDHAENDSGSKREDSCQGVSADNSLLASLSVRSLEDNARTRESMHGHDLPSLKMKVKSPQSKRQRWRPRKNPENESLDDLNGNNQYMQPLAENSSNLLPEVKSPPTKKQKGRPRKKAAEEPLDNINSNDHHLQDLSVQLLENSCNLLSLDMVSTGSHKDHAENDLSSLAQNEHQESFPNNPMILSNSDWILWSQARMCLKLVSPGVATNCVIPMDVALPRMVLCLAHNGKVAWDVKWRPNVYGNEAKHRMGYLAVLLGNGALEVWDVPLPQTMNVIFSGCQEEGTDPRFVKLEPIFRCSKLKCGDRQSIPLTVEWSTSSPHDLILAGCHDGVVALWKFSASGISEDTRPLLCFSADTVPIRALAWAPFESDPESANVIVTAGHRGLKFWDIRDPFRPLWDLNTVQRTVYSLDWLPDPRCIIVSVDDGTLRILSLVKAAYDVPVSGKPFVGTQQQGFHSYYCSPFAIWSVQVSRPTGMVAYCCEDGTVLRFQLTYKAVEKDPLRNRAPHFLCGSLSEEDSALTVISPLPDIPYPMKKSLSEWGNAPRTIRGFLSVSNQEKRAKEQTGKAQTSDDQPLALCYGNDPGTEFGSEDPGTSQTTKQRPKAQASSKKKQKADQALVCRDEEPEKVEKDEMVEMEVFPPKIVAMHRVRWNMNKGSQRWLCYGGAGGIVRCQEIDKSAVR